MVVDNLGLHGITTVVLNLCAALSRSGFRTDILCGGEGGDSVTNALPHDTRIVRLPNRREDTLAYLKALRRCVISDRYDYVHFHCNSATVLADILPMVGLNCKIALHCHNVTCDHPVFHFAFRGLTTRLCDFRFACSSGAGKWMYGSKSFSVIPNCFDTGRYRFDTKKRGAARKEFGIGPSAHVYGHVGVFNKQKNQSFLLEVFEGLVQADSDAVLLLVGDGPLKAKVLSHLPDSLSDRIIVVDPTSQIDKFYCAMDCFLFPSLFESLGLAVVEAQLSGLPCFASNEVPDEARVSDAFYKLPKGASPQEWVNEIEVHYLARQRCPESKERVRSDIDFERYGFEALERLVPTMYTAMGSTTESVSIGLSRKRR